MRMCVYVCVCVFKFKVWTAEFYFMINRISKSYLDYIIPKKTAFLIEIYIYLQLVLTYKKSLTVQFKFPKKKTYLDYYNYFWIDRFRGLKCIQAHTHTDTHVVLLLTHLNCFISILFVVAVV